MASTCSDRELLPAPQHARNSPSSRIDVKNHSLDSHGQQSQQSAALVEQCVLIALQSLCNSSVSSRALQQCARLPKTLYNIPPSVTLFSHVLASSSSWHCTFICKLKRSNNITANPSRQLKRSNNITANPSPVQLTSPASSPLASFHLCSPTIGVMTK
jgi:hypothetical protein